ncbi:hypothetical protein PINS_up011379 [Pythium insidiosum]|nr:hypothetical protein PINS_up011379 [Pythium insidiosum]
MSVPTFSPPRHALLQATDAPLETPRRASDSSAVPESVRRSLVMNDHADVCSEILPGLLYVSNLSVARDARRLAALGITHVINCCREIACDASPLDHIKTLALALRDGVHEDLLPFLYITVNFIEDARRQHGAVLVHCHQGVSRSCAVAIAYVMYHTSLPFADACAFVKARRAISSPNAAFLCQLIEWERDLLAATGAHDGVWDRLYRLAPHAAYDAETFVLKTCYEDASSRTPVRVQEESAPSRAWLWSRGLFVFVNAQREIVVWRGSQCPSRPEFSMESVREHVSRMLRVLLASDSDGVSKAQTPVIVGVDGSALSETETDCDRFGYAEELSWLTQAATKPSSLPETTFGSANEDDTIKSLQTTRVFVLDLDSTSHADETAATVAWELLTEYDSEDLTPGDAVLVVATDSAFLWIGRDCSVELSRLERWGQQQLTTVGATAASTLEIVRQSEETDTFWEAFEAGY